MHCPAKRQVVAGSSTRSGCTNLAAQESSNPSGSITTSSWDCVGQTQYVGGAEGEQGNEALDPEEEGNDLAAVAEEERDDM